MSYLLQFYQESPSKFPHHFPRNRAKYPENDRTGFKGLARGRPVTERLPRGSSELAVEQLDREESFPGRKVHRNEMTDREEKQEMEPEPWTARLMEELNAVRTSPADYAEHLQELLARFEDDMIFKTASGRRVISKKGKQGNAVSMLI